MYVFLHTPNFSGMQLGRKVGARCTVCASILKVDVTVVFSALATRNCKNCYCIWGFCTTRCLPSRYIIDINVVWHQLVWLFYSSFPHLLGMSAPVNHFVCGVIRVYRLYTCLALGVTQGLNKSKSPVCLSRPCVKCEDVAAHYEYFFCFVGLN